MQDISKQCDTREENLEVEKGMRDTNTTRHIASHKTLFIFHFAIKRENIYRGTLCITLVCVLSRREKTKAKLHINPVDTRLHKRRHTANSSINKYHFRNSPRRAFSSLALFSLHFAFNMADEDEISPRL